MSQGYSVVLVCVSIVFSFCFDIRISAALTIQIFFNPSGKHFLYKTVTGSQNNLSIAGYLIYHSVHLLSIHYYQLTRRNDVGRIQPGVKIYSCNKVIPLYKGLLAGVNRDCTD